MRRSRPTRSAEATEATDFTWIDDDAGVAEVVAALSSVDAYALDTEFHRERTYFPHLALVQIAWEPDHLVLIDPLAVDLHPFAEVFNDGPTAVIHAASQDLEVLELAVGTIPDAVFDTQIAAGFIGFSTPSLASLHDRFLGIKLPKGDRLTDWMQRPLANGPLQYAASDVRRLLEIRDLITDQLTERGRLDWALDECELYRTRTRGARDPDTAWLRCKEARHLTGTAAAIARSVAAWRERRAAELDIPVRYVLGDLGLAGIAQRGPRSAAALEKIRGVDARSLKPDVVTSLLDAVAEGAAAEPPKPTKRADAGMDRALRPAVSLVSSWLGQYAHDLDLDPALLATRHDIEAFIGGAEDARLAEGWRHELVGKPIRDLLDGSAALSFDRDHGIVLETRPER